MKKNYFYLMSILLSSTLSLVSCDNSIETEILQKASIETSDIEMLSDDSMLTFIYKGVTYTSECEHLGDSTIILNEEVKAIADKLALYPNLVSLVRSDGIIEYFDDKYEAESWLSNPILSRAVMPDGYFKINGATATLYDDVNYKDRNYPFTIKEGDDPITKELKDSEYKFNDKTSSLKLSGILNLTPSSYPHKRIVLTLYEDDHLSGNSVWFDIANYTFNGVPPHGDAAIPSLKSIPLYPGSSKNWNDKTTSIVLKYL